MNLDKDMQEFQPKKKAPVPPSNPTVLSQSLIYSTSDFNRYNPDDLIGRQGFDIYRKMMRDEQLKAVVHFRRNAVTSRKWSFQFEEDTDLSESDKELRIGVFRNSITRMPGSFRKALKCIMASMHQGFSITEKTFKPFDFQNKSYWGIKKLTKKPFETFYFDVDQFGELEKILQRIDAEEKRINPKRVIHHVHNPEYDEYYGQSELREAYRSWFSKDILIKLENIYLERMAGGFIWAKPETASAALKKGDPKLTQLENIMQNLTTATGLLLPSAYDLTVESPNSTDAFDMAIKKHDKGMAKALLMPNMLGLSETGPNGSRALGDTQLEAFLWLLDAESEELAETLNEQLFMDIGDFNFGDKKYPKFVFNPLSQAMINTIAVIWGDLVVKGAVQATDSDEEFLRELLDMPEKGDSITAPQLPDTPTSPPDTPTNPDENIPANQEDGDKDGTEEPPDEELMAEAIIKIDYQKKVATMKFNRAERRVDFAAIDRSTNVQQWQGERELENAMSSMLTWITDKINSEPQLTTEPKEVQKLKIPPSVNKELKRASRNILQSGWDLGQEHAANEVKRAEGQDRFTKKEIKKFTSLGDAAANYLRAKEFNVAGKISNDSLDIMRNVLFNGIKFSKSTDEIVDDIFNAFATKGLISREDAEEALGEALDVKNPSARLETIVRTNLFDAMNESRFNFFTDPDLGGFVTALTYSAILDGRTTPICRELGGETSPNGEPFTALAGSSEWDGLRPPNHFNCRSLLIPITIRDDQEINTWDVQNEPLEGFK